MITANKLTETWGKDHWSLLAYLECRAVDNKGVVDNKHIRVNSNKRGFSNGAYMGSWNDTHGSRHKGGVIPDASHDDLDVLHELEEAGLVENMTTDLNPCVRMTPYGSKVAALIRQHKSAGGMYNTFSL